MTQELRTQELNSGVLCTVALHTCSLAEWLNNYIWWQNSNLRESSTEINLNLQSFAVGRPLFLKCLDENILIMCYTLYLP